jgi:hypothetical protein
MVNLWYAATRALGFEIGTLCCPDALLVHQVLALYPGVKSLAPLLLWLRHPATLPDVVFLDLGSLPLGPDSVAHWGAWWLPIFSSATGATRAHRRASRALGWIFGGV